MRIKEDLCGGNVAFVIVVCASYASATAALIYSGRPVPVWEVALLVGIGAAYLVVGTYGFASCRRFGSPVASTAYFGVQLLLASILVLLSGSSGELSLILLPLAGQSAFLFPLRWAIPVCALIYLVLLMPLLPLIVRSGWVKTIAIALMYGTGIVFVVGA